MRMLMIATGAFIVLGLGTQAQATPLTLDASGTISFQQVDNRPCVIGEPSCHNPSGFASTTLAPSQSTYTDIASPLYTVQQIRAIVGNTFRVGIDVNSIGASQPLATEVLDRFSLAIDGTTAFLFDTPTQLRMANPGNGYSDGLLDGFDISSFAADATAQFFVTYHDAAAGREQFFLAEGATDTTNGVPEPATLALLGLGLSLLGLHRRKVV